MPLTDKQLQERDAKRNIGEELLSAIQDVKAGRYGAVQQIEITQAAEARSKTGL
ncbi:MAG TPA: transcriptional regulator, partial [Pseudomonas sp.]|nr:transcriptional regulator [Pseudomonas sp.]